MKVLILGGYGVFGGRLAQLLRDVDGLELTICARVQSLIRVLPLEFERPDIALGLRFQRPDLEFRGSGLLTQNRAPGARRTLSENVRPFDGTRRHGVAA